MESRVAMKRVKKRITVRFGQEQADKLAFTEDVSRTGLFIRTTQIVQPGKSVKVAFEVGQEMVNLEGRVVWAKKVPPSLLRVAKKCGMGIRISRFTQGEEAYRRLLSEAA